MLAYVFWHAPAVAADRDGYESALSRFHAALRADPPEGFVRSLSFRAGDVPAAGMEEYEDWYLVDEWAALGRLNVGAVSGSRRAPHDLVARDVSDGAGAVYELCPRRWRARAPARGRLGLEAARHELRRLPRLARGAAGRGRGLAAPARARSRTRVLRRVPARRASVAAARASGAHPPRPRRGRFVG